MCDEEFSGRIKRCFMSTLYSVQSILKSFLVNIYFNILSLHLETEIKKNIYLI